MTLQTKHKIFLASLAFRPIRWFYKVRGKDLGGWYRRSSFNWHLDLNEVVDFMIYISGGFERYLSRFIERNLEEGQVALDIGANVGAHTLQMARSVGASGHTFAIEATDYAYGKLCRNIALNPDVIGQVTPIHAMLLPKGDASSEVSMIHSSWPFDTKSERHATHQGVFKSVGDAKKVALDTLLEELNVTRVDLVKLDVDGNEWDVLSGGEDFFKRFMPTIIMELATDYNDPESTKGIRNIHTFLTKLGYRIYDFNGKALPETIEGIEASLPAGMSKNVVLYPDDGRILNFN